MSRTYQNRINEKSRLDRSTIQYPVEIGESVPVRRRAPPTPFIRDRRVTELLHRLQRDEENRLEEVRRNTRTCAEHNDNREPLRQNKLTALSSRHLPTMNNCSCSAPRYNEANQQTLENSEDRLSDAEILALLGKIQNIDESLADIPDAGADSLYSGLNTLLLNKKSIYNKQRQQRVAHHLSEIRCHAEMLLVSSPQRELLLSLLDSNTSSGYPSPLSPSSLGEST